MELRFLIVAVLATAGTVIASQHDPAEYVYHDHSLSHPFAENGVDIPNWDYAGSAMITEDFIRLTPDRQSRWGSVWNKKAWNPQPAEEKYPGWEMEVEFHVHGQGTKLFGDGFAIWYTRDRMEPGPVFGSRDEFVGLGIFFDTYSNVQQGGHGQYVSVMLGDGKTAYDHANDGGSAKLAGCWHDFRGTEETAWVRIVYDDHLLRVYLDTEEDGEWEECFVIRRMFLPRGYYFGVTAATGDLADNHDIHTIKVADPEPMDEEEEHELKARIEKDISEGLDAVEAGDPQYKDQVHHDPSPFMLLIGLSVVGVVIVFIYMMQTKKKKNDVHFT